MRVLSHSEAVQISGGAQPEIDAYRATVEHIAFITTLLGGGASTIYALATNHTVVTTVGLNQTIASSAPTVMCMGLGISFSLGVIIGTFVALNNYSQSM